MRKITFVVVGCLLFSDAITAVDDIRSVVEPAIQVNPRHDDVVHGVMSLEDFVDAGEQLFRTKFNIADGVGRPEATGDSKPTSRVAQDHMFHRIAGPDASSCLGCHNDPVSGGSGGLAANVFVGAHFTDPPTDNTHGSITNERNTTSLFGSSAIEMLAFEMTSDLRAIRKQSLIMADLEQREIRVPLRSKGVDFGYLTARPNGTYDANEIDGVDMDLVVKPFGVKGVAVSIREFTNFALNQHHGIQSEERFGWSRTGIIDHDGDGVANEFSVGQLSAMVLYQASLPAPIQTKPRDAAHEAEIQLGFELFKQADCGSCHRPSLVLNSAWFFEPNPYNRPGSVVPNNVAGQIAMPFSSQEDSAIFRDETGIVHVRAFTDLKRHVICDEDDMFYCNEQLEQDFVPVDQFLTTKLWDAGTSAPYGHQGNLSSLYEAIVHHSGEAKASKEKFLKLESPQKKAIITFLKTLQVSAVEENLTGDIQ
jgi:hypothetical protein